MSELNCTTPIFIVGAPRSGTSMLRVMLNRHPNIAICDETYFFYYVYLRRRAFGDLQNINNRKILVDRYLSIRRIRSQQLDLPGLSTALMQNGNTYPAFFLSLINYYADCQGKLRCGEKTPQHALYTDLLCDWYPGCKIIHIIRDPRDVVASLMRMPWASKNVTVNALSWLKYIRGAHRASQRPNYLLVHYENVVHDPEAAIDSICTFLGETYNPDILATTGQSNVQNVSKEWWFQRATKQVEKDRIGLWQQELDADQVSMVEWILGSYMDKFGYVRYSANSRVRIRLMAVIEVMQEYLVQRVGKLGRQWYYWVQPTKLSKEEESIDSQN